jgi:phenylacetate-CoA ligase
MHALIYLIGILVKNFRVVYAYRYLKKTEFYTSSQLSKIQEEKLRIIIDLARNVSPQYSELYNEIEIEKLSLNTLDKIPIMTKEKLRSLNYELTKFNPQYIKHIKSETSGSSGEAFVFYRDKWWDAYHRAAIYRGMRQFGRNPWDYNIYFWGFIFSRRQKIKTFILDWLQNRTRVFHFRNIDEQLNSKLKRAKYISGYSSVINNLAEKLVSEGVSYDNIKFVKGTSEKIFPSYKKNVLAAFNVPIVSEYGAAECGIIAFECEAGNMHVQKENVILEEIDNRAIVTNLHSYSLPIIRFDLGDYIALSNVNCKCGRHDQVVSEIKGRVGRDIHGKKNQYPSLTLYYVFKDLALEDGYQMSYSAEQYEKGKIRVLIFQSKNLDNGTKRLILSKFDRYFKQDLDVEVKAIKQIDRKGKLTDFQSYI